MADPLPRRTTRYRHCARTSLVVAASICWLKREFTRTDRRAARWEGRD